MIINLLLDVLHYLLQWLVSILPAWSFNLPQGVSVLVQSAMAYNMLFPMAEIIACTTAYLYLFALANGFKWAVKLTDYIADVIP